MFKIIEKKNTENYFYYKAQMDNDFVFIKKLRMENNELKKQLKNEIHCYNLLKEYPFIPRVLKYNLEENYIVYEYIDGKNLGQFKNLSQNEIMMILIEICSCLENVHRKGIIHCDLKPSNIMIDKNGKIYIIDFANANSVDEKVLFGTKRYCSLEQLSHKNVVPFFDIYSIGVIMYELLSRHLAFKDLKDNELIKAKKENPLLVFGVPNLVNEIIEKATTRDIKRRYQSMSEMKSELLKLKNL